MSELKIHDPAPDFRAEATNDQLISLNDYSGKNIVLYFYPRDNTPGCTQESQDFTSLYQQFTENNTVILGISRDKIKSHHNFKKKYEMPFDLIADPNEEVCEKYAVMKQKNMYGKKVRGIERSTFLIDSAGKIVHIWRNVKVPGHVQEVLGTVKAMR